MHYSKWGIALVLIATLFTTPLHANPAQEQISSMSEKQRKFYFAAFLVKSGERCSFGANRTFFQGSDAKGNAFWNVSCIKGDSLVIQIKNDEVGSTNVLNCKVLKTVVGVSCFTKFKS